MNENIDCKRFKLSKRAVLREITRIKTVVTTYAENQKIFVLGGALHKDFIRAIDELYRATDDFIRYIESKKEEN